MVKKQQSTRQSFELTYGARPDPEFRAVVDEPEARASSAGVLAAVAGLFAVFLLLIIGLFVVLQFV